MKHWVVTTRKNAMYIVRCSCGFEYFTSSWQAAIDTANDHKENR